MTAAHCCRTSTSGATMLAAMTVGRRQRRTPQTTRARRALTHSPPQTRWLRRVLHRAPTTRQMRLPQAQRVPPTHRPERLSVRLQRRDFSAKRSTCRPTWITAAQCSLLSSCSWALEQFVVFASRAYAPECPIEPLPKGHAPKLATVMGGGRERLCLQVRPLHPLKGTMDLRALLGL